MAKAKTLKPTSIKVLPLCRIARWDVADGFIEADHVGVYVNVEVGYLADVEELGAALKAANLYHLNVKEA